MAGRLTIIGGGVMGLMTAYHAAPLAESVTVLDRSRVGDPATASFGLTRSVRNDYRDPEYARLAFEARRLWREFERDCGRRLLAEFILGAVPGADGLYTGVGWRGTGYKFAPWVGRVLAQLALQRGTVYDIGRFTPARFAAEGVAS